MRVLCLLLVILFTSFSVYAQESFFFSEINTDSLTTEHIELIDPVEKMAEFPGGKDSLKAYLEKNNRWHVGQETVRSKVFISFIVETDGNITNIEILRSLRPECDEEAIRLVENMPIWKPGELQGMPVRMKMLVPITFDGLE